MKSPALGLVLSLALASPQLWVRIGAPSQLQPFFVLLFVVANLYWHGLRRPIGTTAQLILFGWTILLLGGLPSIFFTLMPELFLQELVRRVILVSFLWAAYSAAARGRDLLNSVSTLAALLSAVYIVSMALYYAGWSPLRDSGFFDAYPFGLLIPVSIYSNPLIFSETQLLAFFLIASGMFAPVAGRRTARLQILLGLIQFGKGPLLGYFASWLPRTARVAAAMGALALPIGLWLYMGTGTPPQPFDGDYGSFAERRFHLDTVVDSLVNHPTHGLLGYGLRQYGSYLAAQSSSFTTDTVPLSVAQWFFESGIPVAIVGLMLLLSGSVGSADRRLLAIGVFAFIGHLALPNPGDAAVLLVFALLAAESERPARGVG